MLATGTDRRSLRDPGPLGAGGMGQVYRARRVRLGDEVAIKVMQSRRRCAAGARASASCARAAPAPSSAIPNIVGILDFGVDASRPALHGDGAAERAEPAATRSELEAPMAPARVAAILTRVAAALQLAHDRGITHRDLKPANIVAHRYESGERVYKVIDFGLAVDQGDERRDPPDRSRICSSARWPMPRRSRCAATRSPRRPTSTRSASSPTRC